MSIDGIPVGTCGYDPVIASSKDKFLITSPGFPNNYPTLSDCQWNIYASSHQTVEFDLQFLDMEVSHECEFDYLKFFDSQEASGKELYIGCDGKSFSPTKIRSTGRYMVILFHTDDRITENGHRVGFNGTYYATCGGTLHDVEGLDQNYFSKNFEKKN